jgi:hypothetical protein
MDSPLLRETLRVARPDNGKQFDSGESPFIRSRPARDAHGTSTNCLALFRVVLS